jgi:hypothetical protein
MTDDLGAFIRARLDDDAATAERVYALRVALSARHQAPWSEQPDENNALLLLSQYARRLQGGVEAKRHLLATLRPGSPVLSILAYEWSDHPDYDCDHWATETDLNP